MIQGAGLTDAKNKQENPRESSGGWDARQVREIPSVVDQLAIPSRLGPLVFAADLLCILLSFNLGAFAWSGEFLPFNTIGLYAIMGLVVLSFYLADTYQPEEPSIWVRTAARILLSSLLAGLAASTFVYIFGLWGTGPLYGRGTLLTGFLGTTVLAIASRGATARWARRKAQATRWLVVTREETAEKYRTSVSDLFPEAEIVEVRPRELAASDRQSNRTIDQLQEEPWSGILLEEDRDLEANIIEKFMQLRFEGIPIYNLPRFQEEFLYKLPPSKLEDDWFVFSPGFSLIHKRINLRIKRVIDVFVSSLLLLLLGPFMILVAIAIKLESRGPIIYSQIRTGLNGESFELHKFRSMTQNAEQDGAQWAANEDPRVTRVGKWLRDLRIDELPQLWNVLKGEMSLIGPRPERPEFDDELTDQIPYYDLRYLVKPGISGWAQVMHRYGASEDDAYTKLEYDMYYIKNYSLLLDLAIVMKTIRVVLRGKGR